MIPIHPLFSDGEPRLYAAILPCSCPWVYVLKTNELRKYSIRLHRGSRISDNFSLHLARLANEAASDEIQEKCVENSLCITVLRKSPILLPSDALRIHLVTIGVDTVHILKNHYIHNVFCLCREKNNPLMKFRLMWESSSPPFPSLRCSDLAAIFLFTRNGRDFPSRPPLPSFKSASFHEITSTFSQQQNLFPLRFFKTIPNIKLQE